MTEENKLKCGDISNEKQRCYTIYAGVGGGNCSLIHDIVIYNPEKVFYGKGHAFHRIFDGKQTILAPAPGFIWGKCGKIVGYCELSWEPQNLEDPCQW